MKKVWGYILLLVTIGCLLFGCVVSVALIALIVVL